MDYSKIAYAIADRLEKALYKLLLEVMCPYIDSSIAASVKSAMGKYAIYSTRKAPNLNDIKKVLYAYRDMRRYLDSQDAYLADFGIKADRSKDVVIMSGGGGGRSPTEMEQEFLEQTKQSYERTCLRLRAVERALDMVADDDPGYMVIEYKYLTDIKMPISEIAHELGMSESTMRRHEARMLSRLQAYLPSLCDLGLGV